VGVKPRRDALESTSTMINSRKTRRGLRWARYLLDRFKFGQSSSKFDFMYDRDSSYLDQPFTWEVLEQHAPGWSKRIQEISLRYGYTVQDDMVAAGVASGDLKDIDDASVQPI
jgi:hypothetical protein